MGRSYYKFVMAPTWSFEIVGFDGLEQIDGLPLRNFYLRSWYKTELTIFSVLSEVSLFCRENLPSGLSWPSLAQFSRSHGPLRSRPFAGGGGRKRVWEVCDCGGKNEDLNVWPFQGFDTGGWLTTGLLTCGPHDAGDLIITIIWQWTLDRAK